MGNPQKKKKPTTTTTSKTLCNCSSFSKVESKEKYWELASVKTITKINDLFDGLKISQQEKVGMYTIAWQMLDTQLRREGFDRAVSAHYLWESFINILRILIVGMDE